MYPNFLGKILVINSVRNVFDRAIVFLQVFDASFPHSHG